MKRKIVSILASFCIAGSAFAFVGCGHEHTFAEDWSKDATHHWHAATCEHTEEKSDYAEHDYTDDADSTCDTCGYTRVAPIAVWSGETSELPAEVEGVITITNAEQLAGLAKSVNEGTTYEGKTIVLSRHIDLNNMAWTPIGLTHRSSDSNIKKFMGTFNGNGKSIVGLTNVGYTPTSIEEETSDLDTYTYGLFGYTENATIKNLSVTANINCTAEGLKGDSVGAIVGYVNKGITMENCTVNGTVNGGFDAVGGLIGRAYNASATEKLIVKNCTNNATVIAEFKSAGVVGYVAKNIYMEISNCTNAGAIKTTGAIIGATKAAYSAGILNYSWNKDAVQTIIITNNTNSGNIYNMEQLSVEPGVGNTNSYATIANTASTLLSTAISSGKTPNYDFRGNTNSGKVNVAGVEKNAHDVTTTQLYPTYNEADDFNGKTNIVE